MDDPVTLALGAITGIMALVITLLYYKKKKTEKKVPVNWKVMAVTLALSAITGIMALVTTLYYKKKKTEEKVPVNWKLMAFIRKLYIYPLESGMGTCELTLLATRKGFMEVENKTINKMCLRDRSFVVFGERDLEYRTLEHFPHMTRIEFETMESKGRNVVALHAPGMAAMVLEVPERTTSSTLVMIKHFNGEQIGGLDCGNVAAKWISKYLLLETSGLRLAYNDGSFVRDIHSVHKGAVEYNEDRLSNRCLGLYSKFSPIYLINEVSLKRLNCYIDERVADGPVHLESFQANIHITALNYDYETMIPFEEENWDWIRIGGAIMRRVVNCPTCIKSTINPETGVKRKNGGPLITLNRFRMGTPFPYKDNKPFGILLEVVKEGEISSRDRLYIGVTDEITPVRKICTCMES